MTVILCVLGVVWTVALGRLVLDTYRRHPGSFGGYRGGSPPDTGPSVPTRLVRERWVVTLKSGAAFSGVLFEATDRVWLLREVEALGAGENGVPLPVDGELLIRAEDIDYAQRP